MTTVKTIKTLGNIRQANRYHGFKGSYDKFGKKYNLMQSDTYNCIKDSLTEQFLSETPYLTKTVRRKLKRINNKQF